MPLWGRQAPPDNEVRWAEPDGLPDDETSIREADARGGAGAGPAPPPPARRLEGAKDCLWRDGEAYAEAGDAGSREEVPPELRNWVRQAEVDEGSREELRLLRSENRVPRGAGDSPKSRAFLRRRTP